ncbi:hypothetical protein N748_06655 [Legionella pneumophila str. 121004]|nr:hypothetical protein N748_06655 [Legionella pneumophila str. 121004]ERH41755.1 hypothetical protein N751_06040 [Legionella pneumophila str. Leg01/11]
MTELKIFFNQEIGIFEYPVDEFKTKLNNPRGFTKKF